MGWAQICIEKSSSINVEKNTNIMFSICLCALNPYIVCWDFQENFVVSKKNIANHLFRSVVAVYDVDLSNTDLRGIDCEEQSQRSRLEQSTCERCVVKK